MAVYTGLWGTAVYTGSGLTEDEDMLQALQEGSLELALLLLGQLLGHHTAIAQASPQPGVGEVTLNPCPMPRFPHGFHGQRDPVWVGRGLKFMSKKLAGAKPSPKNPPLIPHTGFGAPQPTSLPPTYSPGPAHSPSAPAAVPAAAGSWH